VGWVKGDVDKDGGEGGREMEWTLRIGEVHVSFGAFLFCPPFPCSRSLLWFFHETSLAVMLM